MHPVYICSGLAVTGQGRDVNKKRVRMSTSLSGNFCKSLILSAVGAASVLFSLAAANASDNCDSYAKLTLQQAKQNIDMRCNFTGARWSLDANQHRTWCREVGPAGWRAELKLRNEMLAGCKG